LEFWAAAGITNVGVSLRKLETFGVDAGVAALRQAGLRITNLLGLGFDLADRSRWSGHQDRLAHAVEAASAIGAESFVLTTGSAGGLTWEEAADALEEAIAPVAAAVRGADLPLLFEHTNSLRVDVGFVHTLRDMIDLAHRLDAGVLMECNACWVERGLGDTIAAGIDRIGLVQVSDFVIGTLTTPDRAVPGDGDIPLARLLRQLVDAGYEGAFDIEVIGPRIEAEGYERAVPRSVANVAALLAEIGG
jgi:sugar phosphate isomerase/epimerase